MAHRSSSGSVSVCATIRDRAAGVRPSSLDSFVITSMQLFTIENNGLCWMYPDGLLYRMPISVSFFCACTHVDQVWHRFANGIPSPSVSTRIRRRIGPTPFHSFLSCPAHPGDHLTSPCRRQP